ncbi:MAG: hypothetical protein Q9164_004602 [Protoblastenia rupestris]
MYDDASYYYSSYNAAPQPQKHQKSKHKRRQSLLETPNAEEESQADGRIDGPTLEAIDERTVDGPPQATLKRRAQSYTDFHHAVRAVLSRNEKSKDNTVKGRKSEEYRVEASEGKESIHDDLGFADWYRDSEKALLESSHDEYTEYQKQLAISESHLDGLLSDTSSTLNLLDTLTKNFKAVEAQTTAFQKQCEGLLQEQKRIEKLADDLDHNLNYYNYLEPVTRRLNAPGAGSFVRSKEFSEMLARIDECLEYMAAHKAAKPQGISNLPIPLQAFND